METLHKVRSVMRHGEILSRTTFETACRSMDNATCARVDDRIQVSRGQRVHRVTQSDSGKMFAGLPVTSETSGESAVRRRRCR